MIDNPHQDIPLSAVKFKHRCLMFKYRTEKCFNPALSFYYKYSSTRLSNISLLALSV